MLTPGRVRLNTEPGFFAMETLFDMGCDTPNAPLAHFLLLRIMIFIRESNRINYVKTGGI